MPTQSTAGARATVDPKNGNRVTLERNVSQAIRVATRRLDRAQVELSAAMAELPTVERADKQIVTRRLRLAFEEIVSAKEALTELLDERDAAPPSSESESSE